MRKIIIALIIAGGAVGVWALAGSGQNESGSTAWRGTQNTGQAPASNEPVRGNQDTETTQEEEQTKTDIDLATTLNLNVPFTPQAPTANWDELHNEACEEASALMADAFFKGRKDMTLSASYAEEEIEKLTEWQKNNQGYYLSQTSPEVARMIEEVYELKTKIIKNFTEQQIKEELNQNHLVLLPTNGRLLGNPNYKAPGPIYHMVVIRGYNNGKIITNDPGTRRGLNYTYDFSTLYKATAEWSHSAHTTDTSIKNAIVVWK